MHLLLHFLVNTAILALKPNVMHSTCNTCRWHTIHTVLHINFVEWYVKRLPSVHESTEAVGQRGDFVSAATG